jgi:hypothetical protein
MHCFQVIQPHHEKPPHFGLTILAAFAVFEVTAFAAAPAPPPEPSTIAGKPLRAGGQQVISLDGDKWLIATDPDNTGIANKWFDSPTKEAKTHSGCSSSSASLRLRNTRSAPVRQNHFCRQIVALPLCLDVRVGFFCHKA